MIVSITKTEQSHGKGCCGKQENLVFNDARLDGIAAMISFGFIKYCYEISSSPRLSLAAKAVYSLYHYDSCLQGRDGHSYLPTADIKQALALTDYQVRTALKELEDTGMIERVNRRDGKGGRVKVMPPVTITETCTHSCKPLGTMVENHHAHSCKPPCPIVENHHGPTLETTMVLSGKPPWSSDSPQTPLIGTHAELNSEKKREEEKTDRQTVGRESQPREGKSNEEWVNEVKAWLERSGMNPMPYECKLMGLVEEYGGSDLLEGLKEIYLQDRAPHKPVAFLRSILDTWKAEGGREASKAKHRAKQAAKDGYPEKPGVYPPPTAEDLEIRRKTELMYERQRQRKAEREAAAAAAASRGGPSAPHGDTPLRVHSA